MAKDDPPPQLIPDLHPGKYSDGHPLDDVHYLECKIILKPDRFTSRQGFVEFAKLARRAASSADVDLSTDHLDGQRPEIREVVFLDTADFRLYNNAFILRRRISYEDGFPVGDPEIVFKFRHPDMQEAAEMDVRPHIPGIHRIKFKAETLPLKDKIGGMRVLYSHNVEFGMSQLKESDRAALSALVRLFPCLAALKGPSGTMVELVNQTIVEEVLFEQLGDAGDGYQVKHIMVKPGGRLSLQSHTKRAEHWVVVQGTARVTCDDKVFLLHENQSTYIPVGARHRLENTTPTPLRLIEVQSGSYLGEDDIVRIEDDYRRT